MRIPPFYSPLRGMGLTEAWHDHAHCPIARSIAPTDRRPGKGRQLARCAYCALLDFRPGALPPLGPPG